MATSAKKKTDWINYGKLIKKANGKYSFVFNKDVEVVINGRKIVTDGDNVDWTNCNKPEENLKRLFSNGIIEEDEFNERMEKIQGSKVALEFTLPPARD